MAYEVQMALHDQQNKAVRLLTSIADLPRRRGATPIEAEVILIDRGGPVWRLIRAFRAHIKSRGKDAVVFYQPGIELLLLCTFRKLLPAGRSRLIVVDLILTTPGSSRRERLKAKVKGWLLRNVDLFLLHIKDTSGLREHYGIHPLKARFIPFKVNTPEMIDSLEVRESDYIFTGGKSKRDYLTFVRAMEGLPFRGVVLMPGSDRENALHGTYFETGDVPSNVEIVHDDGSWGSWLRHLAGSKLVVLSITPGTVSAAGVSTYLVAMAMGKCAVMTDCVAVRGILEDGREAILSPEGDADALREAIRRAWECNNLRREVAERGRAYARSLGGSEQLFDRVAAEILAFLRNADAMASALKTDSADSEPPRDPPDDQ